MNVLLVIADSVKTAVFAGTKQNRLDTIPGKTQSRHEVVRTRERINVIPRLYLPPTSTRELRRHIREAHLR